MSLREVIDACSDPLVGGLGVPRVEGRLPEQHGVPSASLSWVLRYEAGWIRRAGGGREGYKDEEGARDGGWKRAEGGPEASCRYMITPSDQMSASKLWPCLLLKTSGAM